MKRTARIITTVAAIALTIVIMCVGIFAAQKITLNSQNATISFTATDVSATVSATKQVNDATAENLSVPGGNETGDTTDGAFKPVFQSGQDYSGDIEVGAITFTSVDDVLTITVSVENTFTTAVSIDAKYTVTCDDANLAVETKVGTEAFTSGSSKTVAQGATVTFTTTIKIADGKKNDVAGAGLSEVPFSFSLELTRAAATPTT